MAQHPRRGEVWMAYLPGRSRDPHQLRPALVVSTDIRNSMRDHSLVVPIFSSGRSGPTRVPLASGSAGLDHDSLLFCDEITTLDHDLLETGPLGGPVPGRVLKDVVKAVRRALDDVPDSE